MTTECGCGRPTRDAAYVCDTCLDGLARALGDVPWLDDELETTITKQRAADGSDGAPSATCSCKDDDDQCQHALVPFHVPAAEARDRLRHELVQLVRFCTEEGVRSTDHRDEHPDDTLPSMSRWLLWRVDGLGLNDMGGEFVSSVEAAVRRCYRVIDLPPERAYAGACPECKADLYHRLDAVEVKCHGCGQTYLVAEVQAWMQARLKEHMADRLVTAREGATLLSRYGLETTQRTIDKWHERGKVASPSSTTAALGTRPARLYRWEDLLALATRHAETNGRLNA